MPFRFILIFFLGLFLLVNLSFVFTPQTYALDCDQDGQPDAVQLDPCPAGILQIQNLLTRLINISVAIAFIALTAVLVYAGIKFITSGGDSKALASASSIVTWGLLGILFLGLAWLILLLIQAFTGIELTNFCIGFPGAQTNCPS